MTQPFNYQVKAFVRSVINQRQKLIDINRSYKDKAEMLGKIDRLRTQLDAYPYTSDRAVALFIINFKGEIFALIPSGNNEARKERFKKYLAQAYNIVNSNKAGRSYHTEGA